MTDTAYTTVAIIPARGGSKGLPRKNVLALGGKPLVAYSIEAALGCGMVDRVVVSTDDPEIAAVAREYGAEVPFLRPPELSGDTAQLGDVLQHAMDQLYHGRKAGIIQLGLLPTHPFRTRRDFTDIITALKGDYMAASTVRLLPLNRHTHFVRNPDGSLTSLTDRLTSPFGPETRFYYRPYGLISAIKFTNQGYGKSYFRVIDNPVGLIDIDTMDDFREAERIVENNLYDYEAD